MRNNLLIIIFSLLALNVFGQLDSIHYMPPMHARVDWGPQFLIISTPEVVAFPVEIKDGSGNLIQTVNISNTQPYKYTIGNSNDTYVFVIESDLHKALTRKGLVLEAKKKFYAYIKIHSNNDNQASDLTCKGRAGLGKSFRIGHLLQNNNSQFSNFIGILATEDSTMVKLSDFDANVKFRINSKDVASNGQELFLLQKGESLVISQYLSYASANQPPNGIMGALLESDKPIVVNTGSWCGSPLSTGDKDTGIDQIVGIDNVGKEYILNKGNGNTNLERPIIVAHYDNTTVTINGATVISLSAGEYYAVPTSMFTAQNNLHIKATQKIYVYQMIGGINTGQNQDRTEGLVFVPPISCSIPNSIDNIFEPNVIDDINFSGGFMITAMKDSAVTVTLDGVNVSLGAPQAVTGNPDFVTYRNLSVFSTTKQSKTMSVKANGAVQVAMVGQNDAASFASFYSGFSKVREPNITLKRIGDGICPDTLVATGLFDGVQWVYADSIIQYGRDTFLVVNAPGDYIAQGYLGVCRQDEIASDTLTVDFDSPEFLYTLQEPSCYGLTDGKITISPPTGGYKPYTFSIDGGFNLSKIPVFTNVASGEYVLVARDSVGCYNRPIRVFVNQPDELTVEITKKSHFNTDIIPLGQTVRLEGVPNRKVVEALWNPNPLDTTCVNCLTAKYKLTETNNLIILNVKDAMGCTASDSIEFYVEPMVYVPNIFNPLSDIDQNKKFILFSKVSLPIVSLHIFNRWGDYVFSNSNISTNSVKDGWDGMFNGKMVNPDVFVYYAEVEVLPGVVQVFKGDVMVAY